jgi:hypothetical protein
MTTTRRRRPRPTTMEEEECKAVSVDIAFFYVIVYVNS